MPKRDFLAIPDLSTAELVQLFDLAGLSTCFKIAPDIYAVTGSK